MVDTNIRTTSDPATADPTTAAIDQPIRPIRSHWLVATSLIVCVAIVIRLALNFRHALLPGMDAAYYPMQSQWLIKYGELQSAAMPLIFWLQAILAKVIMSVSGMPLSDAVSLSARLFDWVCPPLTAIPVMLLGYRWSNGRRSAILLCGGAAVLAVMSPPIIRMAGDLQKNAMGMMWMALSVWAMRESLASPRDIRWWIGLALIFVLAGLTHIGALAATGAILTSSLVAYAALEKNPESLRERATFAGFAIAGVVVATLLVAWLVPSQVQRVRGLVSKVVGFSAGTLPLSAIVYGMLAWLLRELWAQGNAFARCDKAIAIGAAVGLAILSAPIYRGVWSARFQLMIVVPAALLLTLAIAKLHWDQKTAWLQRIVLAVIGILALVSPMAMQGPVLSEAAADELRVLSAKVANADTTLLVAPHGFEFWAGYLMVTRVVKESVPDDVSRYDQILLLKPNEQATGRRAPPNRPQQGFRPPATERFARRGEGPDRARDNWGGNEGPREHGLIVPPEAESIYRSEFFTLYELPR